MKMQISAVMLAAGLVFGSQAANARNFVPGTVYRVAPNGVYLNTADGITYVPNNSASFRVGNTVISLPNLTTGRQVNAFYLNGYTPTYVPNEYYVQHPNWDWDRHVSYWNTDRRHWHHDHGRWHRD